MWKICILQVLKVINDERILPKLEEMLLLERECPKELKDKIDQTIESFELVAA